MEFDYVVLTKRFNLLSRFCGIPAPANFGFMIQSHYYFLSAKFIYESYLLIFSPPSKVSSFLNL